MKCWQSEILLTPRGHYVCEFCAYVIGDTVLAQRQRGGEGYIKEVS